MLDQLSHRPGARHRPKRVGRGPGSGNHKTSGRGMKGQGHRSAGRETPLHFEGGQMPLVRRIPKRGFHNPGRVEYSVVNLASLVVFPEGSTVDVDALRERGMLPKRKRPVKLLAHGDAPKGLTVKIAKASAAAKRKIEEAGGTVEITG